MTTTGTGLAGKVDRESRLNGSRMNATTELRSFDFHIVVDDMTRARSFYEALFGLKAGAIDSEYLSSMSCRRKPSGGAVFGVTNIDAAIERVEQLGGKLSASTAESRAARDGVYDPEGNPFGVDQRT